MPNLMFRFKFENLPNANGKLLQFAVFQKETGEKYLLLLPKIGKIKKCYEKFTNNVLLQTV